MDWDICGPMLTRLVRLATWSCTGFLSGRIKMVNTMLSQTVGIKTKLTDKLG